MKILNIIKSIIVTTATLLVIAICLLFCIFCVMALLDLVTHVLAMAGIPVGENAYVLDDLLEIFEETFSR